MSNLNLKSLALTAAMAGLLAGSTAASAKTMSASGRTSFGAAGQVSSLLDDQGGKDKDKDKHACKGQNSCKGKGGCKTGDNGCKAKNSCKGKGGCATDGSKPKS